jgi:RNA polymerase-binding transcription factor DksA
VLTPVERERVRSWLLRDRDRARRAAVRAAREGDELRQRAGERDPCAYLGAAARAEDDALERNVRYAAEGEERIRRIEAALRLLDEEPAVFDDCAACGARIGMERFEVVPETRVCRDCNARA